MEFINLYNFRIILGTCGFIFPMGYLIKKTHETNQWYKKRDEEIMSEFRENVKKENEEILKSGNYNEKRVLQHWNDLRRIYDYNSSRRDEADQLFNQIIRNVSTKNK